MSKFENGGQDLGGIEQNGETIKSFNESHPELKPDEVFGGNINPLEDWDLIDRKTKRMGAVAYDKEGKILRGLAPVFVQKSEIDEDSTSVTKKILKKLFK